ncbi:peroxisomal leader peptide-processing protease [Cololabis saira]|uniref:peroxisomal leader peptide-processing protease n=1 Tax=Cololabis saira TaxID=129043 RepID=UPI002AD3C2EB|nr:peroxisomal leader peptide-processing protease [Cololabis saira]
MELKDVELCCCAVEVSETGSTTRPLCCSGVLLHPRTGMIICTGLPFARFLTEKETFSSEPDFLLPRSFSDKLQIRVSLCSSSWQQQQVSAELLMLVNCVEFKRAFLEAFQQTDRWRFHGNEEEDDDGELVRDAQFLSWFAVLKAVLGPPPTLGPGQQTRLSPTIGGRGHDTSADPEMIHWQSSSSLQKGRPVVACGSPFGSLCLDLFISTLSTGIISNLAGDDNAVILTDARCLPGTEGGGLFVVNGTEGVRLVGLIVSPFGWKANEWIGLSLVCSFHLIFRNVKRCTSAKDLPCDVWLQNGEPDLHMTVTHEPNAAEYPTVCHVNSGQVWGSGVFVSRKLVVTCRHVVNSKSKVTVKFHHKDRVHDLDGDVLFSTKESAPYDLAFVQLRVPVPEAVLPRMAQSFKPGEAVVVVGYGGLGKTLGPSLTCGVLSKAISLNNQPVMLQTSCAVQAGTSGGAVVHKHTGELLGIVSSNTRDLAARVTYPHLNFSIPVTVFQRLLRKFHQTKDVNVFKVLNATEKEVARVWRLQGTQSKL